MVRFFGSRGVAILGLLSVAAYSSGFLAACSPTSCKNFNKSQNNEGIIGGQNIQAGSPLAASIVGIYDAGVGAICTGSLLDNNRILTAAHCVGPKPEKMFIIFTPDMISLLKNGTQNQVRLLVRQVVTATVNPGWEPEKNGLKDDTWNDLAVLKFRGTVPVGFKPATLLGGGDINDLAPNLTVTLAGYGVDQIQTAKVDPTLPPAPTVAGTPPKDEVVCNHDHTECVSMKSSGSGVLRFSAVSVVKVLSHEVVVDQTQGKGACSGDSGGPAYVLKNGQYFLWGITSRGTPGCNEEGVYTNVLTYRDWVAAQ
jgi:secreted trypsin-like serine protease